MDPAPPVPISSDHFWHQKTLLTLDGGGLRTFSSLITLNELFERVAQIENELNIQDGDADLTCVHDARPCLYFDYIAGTGTGGLLAILLGRLRMNLKDATNWFENLLKKVYCQPRRIRPLFARPLYDTAKLEKNVQDIVRQSPPKARESASGEHSAFLVPEDITGEVSRTLVCATLLDEYGSRPYLFRSYRAPVGEQGDQITGASIWEVARATAAAPAFFRPTKIKGRKFRDGGMEADNPTAQVMQEVRRLANATRSSNTAELPEIFGAIVNLGNGPGNPRFLLRRRSTDPNTMDTKEIKKHSKPHMQVSTPVIQTAGKGPKTALLKRNIKADATLHPKSVDEAALSTLQEKAQSEVRPLPYFRFGLDEEPLSSDWETGQFDLSFIKRTTTAYLAKEPVADRLRHVAQILVNIRRSRVAEDNDRWTKFAYDEPPFRQRVRSWSLETRHHPKANSVPFELLSANRPSPSLHPPARAKTEEIGRSDKFITKHEAEMLFSPNKPLLDLHGIDGRVKLDDMFPDGLPTVRLLVFAAHVSWPPQTRTQTIEQNGSARSERRDTHFDPVPHAQNGRISADSRGTTGSEVIESRPMKPPLFVRAITWFANGSDDSGESEKEWVLIFYVVPPKERFTSRRKSSIPHPWGNFFFDVRRLPRWGRTYSITQFNDDGIDIPFRVLDLSRIPVKVKYQRLVKGKLDLWLTKEKHIPYKPKSTSISASAPVTPN